MTRNVLSGDTELLVTALQPSLVHKHPFFCRH
jgi:hypothetical protein